MTEIANKTGIGWSETMKIVNCFMECVMESLSNGDNVYLRDFGSFTIKFRAQRCARDISRAKTVVIPLHRVPAFKPNKVFTLGRPKQDSTSIVIPDSETEIQSFAFQGRTELTSVRVGNSVTKIGDGAFQGCKNLAEIVIPDAVAIIGNKAFQGCTSLSRIAIPASVTEIRRQAFAGCGSLSSIAIPDGVTKIRRFTFIDCKNLTSIVIPDSVTEIGCYAFSGCSGLMTVIIGSSVKKIEEGAFAGCTGLTRITFGQSVRKIGERAFSGCVGLEKVDLPASLTELGEKAFPAETQISVPPGSSLRIKQMTFRKLGELITKANRRWAYDACRFIDYSWNDDDVGSPFKWEEITAHSGILHVDLFPPDNLIIAIMENLADEAGIEISIRDELKAHKITDVVQQDTINQYIMDYFSSRKRGYYFTSADISKGEFKYRMF